MTLSRRDLLLVAGTSALTKAVGAPASKIIENEWITMPDGVRLGARIFLPESAARKPAGAILEYIPYRKRDIQRRSDERTGAILNQAGFAYVRVDEDGGFRRRHDRGVRRAGAPSSIGCQLSIPRTSQVNFHGGLSRSHRTEYLRRALAI